MLGRAALSMLALAPIVAGLQVCSRLRPLVCFQPPALRVPVLVAALYGRVDGDEGEVDVDKVSALLEERAELREGRDYDAADEVRDELVGMGVTVLDKDMVWYVGDRPKGFQESCSGSRLLEPTSHAPGAQRALLLAAQPTPVKPVTTSRWTWQRWRSS